MCELAIFHVFVWPLVVAIEIDSPATVLGQSYDRLIELIGLRNPGDCRI